APRSDRGGRRFESCRPDHFTRVPGSSNGRVRRPERRDAGSNPAPGSTRAFCPRSSTDQSGGGRSLRVRVRLAPWTPFGELAERQGIAVLTRRDRKVAQVRSLHSPPSHFDAPQLFARNTFQNPTFFQCFLSLQVHARSRQSGCALWVFCG